MKYKAGDEVIIKGTIAKEQSSEKYLKVVFRPDTGEAGTEGVVSVDCFQSSQKQFPREMWVWDLDKTKKKKEKVVFISDKGTYPVWTEENNGFGSYRQCAEIEPLNLSLSEAKKIIAEAKGVDKSEINILNS